MPKRKPTKRDQASKLLELIFRFENTPSMHGQEWCDKMAAHYRGRYLELTGKNAPKVIKL